MAAAAEPGPSGLGIGWRPEIAGVVSAMTDLGFTEVIAEALVPAAPPRGVAELRERGVSVVPHGVRLSLGGTDPLDAARVTHLAACAAAVGAPLVSEHVAFVRAGGRDAGHLLPLPRTREALDVLAANVARTQAELDVPLALEPIAALFDWPDDEFDDGEFLTRLLDRTGARLLLDVANVYANAVNRGQDPESVLDTFPLDRIAYAHIAGGSQHDGHYHDTHTAPVPAAVLRLLGHLVDRLPTPPAVMLERDGSYPPAAQLHAELAAIRTTVTPRVGPSACASRGLAVRESGSRRARVGVSMSATWPPAPRSEAGPGRDGRAERGRAAPPARAVPARPAEPAGSAPAVGGPSRADLAARQSALVAALVAGDPAPVGFDPARLAATRRALLRKRAGEAAKAWPLLAASLGDGWTRTFAELRDGHAPVGALRDGWDVARALHTACGLGDGAVRELADRDRALRYDGTSAPVPRLRARLGDVLRRR